MRSVLKTPLSLALSALLLSGLMPSAFAQAVDSPPVMPNASPEAVSPAQQDKSPAPPSDSFVRSLLSSLRFSFPVAGVEGELSALYQGLAYQALSYSLSPVSGDHVSGWSCEVSLDISALAKGLRLADWPGVPLELGDTQNIVLPLRYDMNSAIWVYEQPSQGLSVPVRIAASALPDPVSGLGQRPIFKFHCLEHDQSMELSLIASSIVSQSPIVLDDKARISYTLDPQPYLDIFCEQFGEHIYKQGLPPLVLRARLGTNGGFSWNYEFSPEEVQLVGPSYKGKPSAPKLSDIDTLPTVFTGSLGGDALEYILSSGKLGQVEGSDQKGYQCQISFDRYVLIGGSWYMPKPLRLDYSADGVWQCSAKSLDLEAEHLPSPPSFDQLSQILGQVSLSCENSQHQSMLSPLLENSYSLSPVYSLGEKGFGCTLSLDHSAYLQSYLSWSGGHKIASGSTELELIYDPSGEAPMWQPGPDQPAPLSIVFLHSTDLSSLDLNFIPGPGPYVPGGELKLSLHITNRSGAALKDISIICSLDSNLELLQAHPKSGTSFDHSTWTLSRLANGASAALDLDVRIKDQVKPGTSISSSAQVTAASGLSGGAVSRRAPLTVQQCHQLRFDLQGGKAGPKDKEYWSDSGNTLVELPGKRPSRLGYRFQGWSASPEGEALYQPGDELQLDSDSSTLYAVWSKGSSPSTGDDSSLMLWAALSGISSAAAVLCAAIILRRYRSRS